MITSTAQVYNSTMTLNEIPLIQVTDSGLYCDRGGFFIDPWCAVDRAVVTHAHADHLCGGCGQYLLAHDGLTVAHARLRDQPVITTVHYGEPVDVNSEVVDALNAEHASSVTALARADVFEHLRLSGDEMIALVNGLSLEQLSMSEGRVERLAQIAGRHADAHRSELEEALAIPGA